MRKPVEKKLRRLRKFVNYRKQVKQKLNKNKFIKLGTS